MTRSRGTGGTGGLAAHVVDRAEQIAKPLGFDDYRPAAAHWIREPGKSIHPAYEFPVSARDLARVGQLVLQNGAWEGKQLIASSWLRESLAQ